jgi:hypothetical protein
MDTVGFGPEVTGVAVFVAGMGNLGRSLPASLVPVPHGELRVAAKRRTIFQAWGWPMRLPFPVMNSGPVGRSR